ncbi:GL20636 [Drosophila persimilis]|uniref:GL20636 n=1 Tax=Drosophila persimilis TaxID=7234 RepID=B4GI69_DROPE|nr:GL20636 [Drosophila persimilis]
MKHEWSAIRCATGETAISISRCMEVGFTASPETEPCAYAFHLVMCAHKADHLIIDYDEEEEHVEYV